MRADIARFTHRPLFSIVMATYESPEGYLLEAIASVQAQIYDNWELCIADDASSAPHVARILRQAAAADSRIKVFMRPERGHISAASNSALALARGEWVVLMDHDDLIPRDTLYELAAEIMDHPEVQVIYTDEDKIDGKGRRYGPYFKPDFDPDLLLGQNVVNHLAAYRRDLIVAVGGFRKGFEGSQDHDLILRATAQCGPAAVRHIPRILYHWRQETEGRSFSEGAMARCVAAARVAITEHLQLRGYEVELQAATKNFHRIVFALPDPAPLVSVIIPRWTNSQQLHTCLYGLLRRTQYAALEVLVVRHGSTDLGASRALSTLLADPRVRMIDCLPSSTLAERINEAAEKTCGQILLLLDQGVSVVDENWLREMVSQAVRPDVGAVGCRVVDATARLLHGGLVLGRSENDASFLAGAHYNDNGPSGLLKLMRSVSAVSTVCLALRQTVWQQIGGMKEQDLETIFQDIDLCLSIRKLGLRIVWTPFALMSCQERREISRRSHYKKDIKFQENYRYMCKKWGDDFVKDSYYNPNYSRQNGQCRLSAPFRRKRVQA
ncbi:hypothetical protein APE01nite_10280 [Acetobacter peroxydans]|uniref:Glycosyltransferase 2-like domain-containing protein n=2 Tax=Acetobacter peroxydans TaxID=104098 RepID=A0A4Y3TQC9_9PROT|nr:hypothetical protein APE01nite_10280 [Acetobacter peroxydans]